MKQLVAYFEVTLFSCPSSKQHLIRLCEGTADIENNTAKEMTKLAAVIQVPSQSANQCLGEGGLQVQEGFLPQSLTSNSPIHYLFTPTHGYRCWPLSPQKWFAIPIAWHSCKFTSRSLHLIATSPRAPPYPVKFPCSYRSFQPHSPLLFVHAHHLCFGLDTSSVIKLVYNNFPFYRSSVATSTFMYGNFVRIEFKEHSRALSYSMDLPLSKCDSPGSQALLMALEGQFCNVIVVFISLALIL